MCLTHWQNSQSVHFGNREYSFALYTFAISFREIAFPKKIFARQKKDIEDKGKKKSRKYRERMVGPPHHFHIILFIVYQTDIPDISSCRYIS